MAHQITEVCDADHAVAAKPITHRPYISELPHKTFDPREVQKLKFCSVSFHSSLLNPA